MATLTELVITYKATGRGLQEIVDRMSTMAYTFPRNYRGFDEDDAGEFLLFLYPKLPKLVDKFYPTGTPFEHYFKRCLRFQVKSYATALRSRRARYKAEMSPGLWPDGCVYGEEEVREDEASYGGDFFDRAQERPSLADPLRRRLLVLVLKVCVDLEDSQLRRIAKKLDVSAPWLIVQRDRIEERLRKKDPRLAILRGRRNSAFATIVQVQGELSRCGEPVRRQRLEHRLRVHLKRLDTARSLIARVPLRPTNDEIAEILEIPKGSVDSTLYYLRNGMGFRHTRRHDGVTARNKQSAQKARVRTDLRQLPAAAPGRR
jgi:hypothetical protein